jgi:hypothetical protein
VVVEVGGGTGTGSLVVVVRLTVVVVVVGGGVLTTSSLVHAPKMAVAPIAKMSRDSVFIVCLKLNFAPALCSGSESRSFCAKARPKVWSLASYQVSGGDQKGKSFYPSGASRSVSVEKDIYWQVAERLGGQRRIYALEIAY